MNIFDTVPHDDYAPQLLYYVGADGGVLPSPWGYRVLYPLVGAAFYAFSPLVPLSEVNPAISVEYARATQALALVSYLAMVAVAAFAYRIARERLDHSPIVAAATALVVLVLVRFSAYYTIDPLTIAWIAAALFYARDRRVAFAVLLLGSVVVNEKIALVFALLSLARLVLEKESAELPRLAVSLAALALYFAIRAVVGLTGNEQQTDPTTYAPALAESVRYLLSVKGLYLNVLPLLLLGAIWLAACAARRLDKRDLYLSPSIVVVPLALFGLGMALDLQWTIGRIAMHALPLFVGPIAGLLSLLEAPLARPARGSTQRAFPGGDP